jgi:hypothetical protein
MNDETERSGSDRRSDMHYDIGTLDEVVKINAQMTRTNTRVIRALVISFLIDIILTVIIGYGVNELHTVTTHAEYSACVAGNKTRSDETQLWNYVFSKFEPTHPTVQQRQAFSLFEAQLNRDLKLRNCKALYG